VSSVKRLLRQIGRQRLVPRNAVLLGGIGTRRKNTLLKIVSYAGLNFMLTSEQLLAVLSAVWNRKRREQDGVFI